MQVIFERVIFSLPQFYTMQKCTALKTEERGISLIRQPPESLCRGVVGSLYVLGKAAITIN